MRAGATIISAVTLSAPAALASCGTSDVPPKQALTRVGTAGATGLVAMPPHGARADCSMRSEARFPGAFADPRNLVVGPLVLVGGAEPTPRSTIRQFGGQKFPLLLEDGHKVTVRIAASARPVAGLAYIPHSYRGRRQTLRGADRSITFLACRRTEKSGSAADHAAVTFWSGFVVTRVPICVPLDIYVDEQSSARRELLSLGARCQR
jgi:hypothetical protein